MDRIEIITCRIFTNHEPCACTSQLQISSGPGPTNKVGGGDVRLQIQNGI